MSETVTTQDAVQVESPVDSMPELVTDLQHLDTPLHQAWRANNRRVRHLAMRNLYPGCLGLAVIAEQDFQTIGRAEVDPVSELKRVSSESPAPVMQDRVILSADHCLFLSLMFVPPGHSLKETGRDIRLCRTTRVTVGPFGKPVLNFRTPSLDYRFDFRRCPYNQLQVNRLTTAGVGEAVMTLNHNDKRMFGVANAVQKSVLDWGFAHQPAWKGTDEDKSRIRSQLYPQLYASVDSTNGAAIVKAMGRMPIRYWAQFLARVVDGMRIYSPVSGTIHQAGRTITIRSENNPPVEFVLPDAGYLTRSGRVRAGDEIGIGVVLSPEELSAKAGLGKALRTRLLDQFQVLQALYVEQTAVYVDGVKSYPYELLAPFLSVTPEQVYGLKFTFWDFTDLVSILDESLVAGVLEPLRLSGWRDNPCLPRQDVQLITDDESFIKLPCV